MCVCVCVALVEAKLGSLYVGWEVWMDSAAFNSANDTFEEKVMHNHVTTCFNTGHSM